MRTLLLLICLAYLPIALSAQLNEVLKDPNVTWAAIFTAKRDFRLTATGGLSEIQLTKFTPPENQCANFKNDNWLAQWLIDGMKAGQYRAFDDPEMKVFVGQPVLLSRITQSDVITTFDPATYEEKTRIINNDLKADEIVGFQTSEVIYFDKKSGGYQTCLLALAPMVRIRNDNGSTIGDEPIAWLAMDGNQPSSPNDVIWSVLSLDKKASFKTNELQVVKDDQKQPFLTSLWQTTKSGKLAVKSSEKYGCGEELPKAALEQMFSVIDTIITFDAETYKESMQIVKHTYDDRDVQTVKLVQEWYFDNRRKMLGSRLKAIAPVIDVKDVNGIFLYNCTMFYLYN